MKSKILTLHVPSFGQTLILVGRLCLKEGFLSYVFTNKKINLIPDKFGKVIQIPMIGLYEDDGKWIKWVKLNDELVKVLSNTKIKL
jgi:hypothetical protein